MSHLVCMATLLRSLPALFRSWSAPAAEADPLRAARALLDEDFQGDAADTTAPPWSTPASLFPAAIDLAAASLDADIEPRFRLPLPLQAYVAGGALALFCAWLGHHPPQASLDDARGEVMSIGASDAASPPAPTASLAVTDDGVDIASLPTVSIGKLPVSAILTIRVEELPNARRLAVSRPSLRLASPGSVRSEIGPLRASSFVGCPPDAGRRCSRWARRGGKTGPDPGPRGRARCSARARRVRGAREQPGLS